MRQKIQFLLTNYKLYVIKIIRVPLETSFEYESNDIKFMIYISFFLAKFDGQSLSLNYMRVL
jgi:hypothetical protein